ncbi:unnamed protein product [Effrenium voratum]|nr:unnamed protein product [Effrenium voratum]
MQPGAAQLVSDIEHARAERLRRVELRVEKAERRHAQAEAAANALRQQHSADLAKEGAQSAQRVQAMRQQGETSMLAAEARARAARERREELEAQVAAIGAETAELEAEAAARREQLAERLQDIDVRTAKAVLSAEVEMQSLRLEAAESAKATYVALQQEGIKTRQRQDQFGGLREAITGVTACQRDHQLQSVPVVKPRTFDLEESPFDGVGKFGSSKPLQVPKGFYAEAGAAKAARRIAKPTP